MFNKNQIYLHYKNKLTDVYLSPRPISLHRLSQQATRARWKYKWCANTSRVLHFRTSLHPTNTKPRTRPTTTNPLQFRLSCAQTLHYFCVTFEAFSSCLSECVSVCFSDAGRTECAGHRSAPSLWSFSSSSPSTHHHCLAVEEGDAKNVCSLLS